MELKELRMVLRFSLNLTNVQTHPPRLGRSYFTIFSLGIYLQSEFSIEDEIVAEKVSALVTTSIPESFAGSFTQKSGTLKGG